MSNFRFYQQDSDADEEYPHPNSRRSVKAKQQQESDEEDAGLPSSCSTKVADDSKFNDFILMLLMVMALSGSIYYMHTGGYSLEIVQVAPTQSDVDRADHTKSIIETLKKVMMDIESVSALNMGESHELKSDLKLTIKGGQFESQHLILQLMTFEQGERAKLESAAGIDPTTRMQQGNMFRDAERI